MFQSHDRWCILLLISYLRLLIATKLCCPNRDHTVVALQSVRGNLSILADVCLYMYLTFNLNNEVYKQLQTKSLSTMLCRIEVRIIPKYDMSQPDSKIICCTVSLKGHYMSQYRPRTSSAHALIPFTVVVWHCAALSWLLSGGCVLWHASSPCLKYVKAWPSSQHSSQDDLGLKVITPVETLNVALFMQSQQSAQSIGPWLKMKCDLYASSIWTFYQHQGRTVHSILSEPLRYTHTETTTVHTCNLAKYPHCFYMLLLNHSFIVTSQKGWPIMCPRPLTIRTDSSWLMSFDIMCAFPLDWEIYDRPQWYRDTIFI